MRNLIINGLATLVSRCPLIIITLCAFVLSGKAQRPSSDYNQPILEYYQQEDILQMKQKIADLKNTLNKKNQLLAKRIESEINNFENTMRNLANNERDILHKISATTLGSSYRIFYDVIKLPNGQYSISKLDPYGLRLMLASKQERADAIIHDIKKLKNLRLISFCNCSLTSQSISQLAEMKNLNSITFNINATDDDVRILLSELPALKHIRFIKCDRIKGDFLATGKMTLSIEEMEWVDTLFNKENLQHLLAIDSLKYVFINGKEIRISGTFDSGH